MKLLLCPYFVNFALFCKFCTEPAATAVVEVQQKRPDPPLERNEREHSPSKSPISPKSPHLTQSCDINTSHDDPEEGDCIKFKTKEFEKDWMFGRVISVKEHLLDVKLVDYKDAAHEEVIVDTKETAIVVLRGMDRQKVLRDLALKKTAETVHSEHSQNSNNLDSKMDEDGVDRPCNDQENNQIPAAISPKVQTEEDEEAASGMEVDRGAESMDHAPNATVDSNALTVHEDGAPLEEVQTIQVAETQDTTNPHSPPRAQEGVALSIFCKF